MGHPDLVRLGRTLRNRLDDTLDAEQAAARAAARRRRTLRNRLDDTLDAEQAAARAAARRRRTLRDRLLDSEDRTEHVVLTTSDGQIHRGLVEAVGVDHVVVIDGPTERFIAINHIITVEARS